MTRRIIGLAGSSCSYKSTVAELLEHAGLVERFRGDGFYGHQLPPLTAGLSDWDSPGSIDLFGMSEAIAALRRGDQSVEVPVYKREINRRDGRELFIPRPEFGNTILVDSLFALHDPIFAQLDFKIVMDIPDAWVLERRRKRQGAKYTDEYHERVMVPALALMRPLWRERADVYLTPSEGMTSAQIAEQILSLLAKQAAGLTSAANFVRMR